MIMSETSPGVLIENLLYISDDSKIVAYIANNYDVRVSRELVAKMRVKRNNRISKRPYARSVIHAGAR
jgi:hypothetical protein